MEIDIKIDLESVMEGLRSSENYLNVGDLSLGGIVNDVSSTILGYGGENKTLETHINIDKETFWGEGNRRKTIDFKAISAQIGEGYEIIASSATQLVLRMMDVDYFFKMDNNYLLICSLNVSLTSKSDKNRIDAILKNYGELLKRFIESVNEKYGKPGDDSKYIYSLIANRISNPTGQQIGPSNSFGRSGLDELERRIESPDPDISFDAIGGNHQAKEEMFRICNDVITPEIAGIFGRDTQRMKGYLIFGEPGTGKTLLVRALATMIKQKLDGNVKFYHVNYEDVTSIFRGGEAQATGNLFKLVERNEADGVQTVLFLDEVHRIGQRNNNYNEALDSLLSHLDGMKRYKGLVVIGATYMPIESLDPALTRQGRLGKHIQLSPPNEEERKEILEICISEYQTRAADYGNSQLFNVDLHEIARQTEGFTGSMLSGLVEKSVERKERDTRRIAGIGPSPKDILAKFVPVDTDYMRMLISEIKSKPNRGEHYSGGTYL